MRASLPVLADVRAAANRIGKQVHRTPVLTCRTLDELSGRRLFFKCEHLQRTGAFKFRGASNAVLSLSDEEARRGVVTHSSGNHAQALALAGRLRGVEVHVVMPAGASAVKRRAVEGYGARVVECGTSLPERAQTAALVVRETGGILIPPFDHRAVIAGQGTVALELLAQARVDTVVAPVGGGGLLSGIATVVRELTPETRVYGAEPEAADDAARSFRSGKWMPMEAPETVADGLLASLGDLTWPIIRDKADGILTVSEKEIVSAMRLAWQYAKLLIEPSAAVALAVVLSEEFRALPEPKSVGIVLSGGNVDLDRLPW